MNSRLSINKDNSERISYDAPDFPVHIFDEPLSRMTDYACGCHWHEDFEILIAREGEMDYFVNGQVLHLAQGQGIFANSRRLHYGFSPQHRECAYYGFVFHPSVLGQLPLPMARYAQTLGSDEQLDYLLLEPQCQEDRQIIADVERILELMKQMPELYELQVQGLCGRILTLLWGRMGAGSAAVRADPAWVALRQMVGYIQGNYGSQIRLEDIAAAGAVCRSKCCALFRERMGTTPVGYLNSYRMNKAASLLRSGSISVTEAGRLCGFDNPSYFTESFRKFFGVSPRQMRGS